MKKNFVAIGILGVLFWSILSISGSVFPKWTSYHNFEGRCLDCHLTEPKDGEVPTVYTKDITNMCKTCHSSSQQLSHPVDVKPSMQIPGDFPVDWKGDITCITCHPVHKDGFGDYHLRSKATGQGFCIRCHGDLEVELHKASVGTAHIGGTSSSKYVPGELDITLDELSLKCMACHDATFSKDTLVENPSLVTASASGLFHNNNMIGLSHPIGVSYMEAKRKYRGAYRDISQIPSEVRLFGGLVGCGSCHNPYSKRHFELVMSNEKSALCLACHVK